jgi:hypothetical protein
MTQPYSFAITAPERTVLGSGRDRAVGHRIPVDPNGEAVPRRSREEIASSRFSGNPESRGSRKDRVDGAVPCTAILYARISSDEPYQRVM